MRTPEETLREYIQSYNSFDIDKMLSLFTEDCIFENISNSSPPLKVVGIRELEKTARGSSKLFKERQQKIVNQVFADNRAAVRIEYNAVLASDLPNGMKAGQTLNLQGASFFEFEGRENQTPRRFQLTIRVSGS